MPAIRKIESWPVSFALPGGAGSDAVHTDPEYGYAVTRITTDGGDIGYGISFTLVGGTELVCRAIELLCDPLLGYDVELLRSRFGQVQRQIAEHPRIRWLGPHKGVIHLALRSITNACFDL